MTISEIRDILKQETVEKTVLEEIMADERKGVRQLVDAYIRRLNRESAERFRVEDMTRAVGGTCHSRGSYFEASFFYCGT